MNKSDNNHYNILDLPDEILFIIFKKLEMVDVFYSLVDANQRFNRLAFDSSYIRHLDMTTIRNKNSLYDQISSIDTQLLSAICEKFLPKIHHQVHKLTVEQDSMKQILRAANYPQLYSLSLINFEEKILYQYLTDDLVLRDLLAKQVIHLNIDIKVPTGLCSKTVSNIFALILSLCKKLTVLKFCDMFITRNCETPVFYLGSVSKLSSTLSKLKINVVSFADCLLLLDGRLDSLSTLIVNVSSVFDPFTNIGGRKKLLKLKCFSFTAFHRTYDYDSLIVPLLRRMINLEELQLYLEVGRMDSTFIDGIQLYDQFLIHMRQLEKFTFNIKTIVFNKNNIVELPSNEDIQRSFVGKGYQQAASYVHTDPCTCYGECHIYSLPYEFDYFVNLNNCFQGGMFHKVRQLDMDDSVPFKHKLFQIISHDFPFLEFLRISNTHQMQDRQQPTTLITFSYLTFLDLKYAHVDYVELFLLEKNSHLPCLLNLSVKYESLTKITKNFMNDATQFNFGKLTSLDVCQSFVRPENFHQYFPLL